MTRFEVLGLSSKGAIRHRGSYSLPSPALMAVAELLFSAIAGDEICCHQVEDTGERREIFSLRVSGPTGSRNLRPLIAIIEEERNRTAHRRGRTKRRAIG